jgi:hypothetical protein
MRHLQEWQAHTWNELLGVLECLLEYDQRGEAASRLEAIARELRECFSDEIDPEMERIERSIRYRDKPPDEPQ